MNEKKSYLNKQAQKHDSNVNWRTVHYNKTLSHLKAEQSLVRTLCGYSRLFKGHQEFSEAEESKSAVINYVWCQIDLQLRLHV